jgi:tetratricopeptide (TPR) repeat protein
MLRIIQNNAVAAAFACFTAAGANALADDRSDLFYRQGVRSFERHHYRRAIQAFKHAFDVDPRPVHLLNIGLCHRRLGQRHRAAEAYRAYLFIAPGGPDVVEARMLLALLDGTETLRELRDRPQQNLANYALLDPFPNDLELVDPFNRMHDWDE